MLSLDYHQRKSAPSSIFKITELVWLSLILSFFLAHHCCTYSHHHGPPRCWRRWARRFFIFFCVPCGWQWITVTQRGTPSVAIGSKCFPWLWRDVEARHVTLDDVFILYSAVWVCQFNEARYRTHRRGYPWTDDHLPYDGHGLARADVAALWLQWGHMNRWDAGWWS